MPIPPGITPAEKAKVSVNETAFILDKCLKPEHRDNPDVLRFINSYLLCRDARQSAREIGLEPRVGTMMRNQPDIYEAIKGITQIAVMKHGYDAEEIVEKVKEIAFIDPAELENADGTYIESLRKLPPEVRRAIKSLKVKNEYTQDPNGMPVISGKIISYEFWDKMKAVELLGREKDTFKETKKVEHDMGSKMADVLLDSKKRAEQKVLAMKDVTPSMPVPEIIDGE